MPEQMNAATSLYLLLPDDIFNACGRTLDTAAAEAGIALDAAQRVSRQQFDVAQQIAAVFSSMVRGLGNAALPADAIDGQAEYLRASCGHAFAGTSQVATIMQYSGEATLALLGKRGAGAMEGFGCTAARSG